MSRKHVIKLDLFKGVSANMAGILTSKAVSVNELDKASIHLSWVAGPEGTFTVEAQNFNDGVVQDPWYALNTGSPWSVVAADSQAQIVLNEIPFVNLRLVWTPTSGSGTLRAFLTSKTTGA